MSQDFIEEVAARIRKGKDLTQEQMAAKLKITPGAYAKIERGETDPNITRLKDIAIILKISLNALITGSDEKIRKSAAASIPEMEILYKHLAQISGSLDRIQIELSDLKKAAKKKSRGKKNSAAADCLRCFLSTR